MKKKMEPSLNHQTYNLLAKHSSHAAQMSPKMCLKWYSNSYTKFPGLQRHVGQQLMIQKGEQNESQFVTSHYAPHSLL